MVGLLTGEPEYIDPLKDEAPEGWLVTGYPWYDIDTPAHNAFLAAYQQRWDDYPRIGSVVGYNTMLAIEAMLELAGSTETEAMVDALEGLSFDAPTGPITFRAIDHQVHNGGLCGLDHAARRTGHHGRLAVSRRRGLPAVGRRGSETAQPETEPAHRQGPPSWPLTPSMPGHRDDLSERAGRAGAWRISLSVC